MLKRVARRVLEHLLSRFEYRLVDASAQPVGLAGVCRLLKARGFSPNTVIDVGVGGGTPWLYAAFPKAKFELFEPIESFRPMIEKAISGIDASVHYCALGEQGGESVIEVDHARPTSSSMAHYREDYIRASGADARASTTVSKVVSVRTLDDFGPFSGPTLIKLDVEGYESQVIAGARRTLQNADVIISEVSVVRRTETELSFGSYVSLLESLDYSIVDIAEITSLGRGGPIAYMDVVLMRSGSPLRYVGVKSHLS